METDQKLQNLQQNSNQIKIYVTCEDGDVFATCVNKDKIPKDSLLEVLSKRSPEKIAEERGVSERSGKIVLKDVDLDDVKRVIDILEYRSSPTDDLTYLFDYLNIDVNSYEFAVQREEYIRNSMYMPGFEKAPMNTDPYFDLVKVDEELWKSISTRLNDEKGCLFIEENLRKRKWKDVLNSLDVFKYIFKTKNGKNTFLAGGAIFSVLFESKYSDIDIFIHSCKENIAIKSISDIVGNINKTLHEIKEGEFRLFRTANAITLRHEWRNQNRFQDEYQIVLRLYKTPSEILHGFDVDCCSVGFDGKDIWMTRRALFAIKNGFNTVNFNRLSPSYGIRMVKYGLRGMAIKIPNFSRDKVKHKAIKSFYVTHMNLKFVNKRGKGFSSSQINYNQIKDIKGIDFMLYMDYYTQQARYNEMMIGFVGRLDKERSDYTMIPHIMMDKYDSNENVWRIIEYLDACGDTYPNTQKLANEFLVKAEDEYLYNDCYINNFFKHKSISYISMPVLQYRDPSFILNINEDLYNLFGMVRPWEFPAKVGFKTTNPGEQMTNTFNRLVLEDTNTWYKGDFYRN